ncbi:hypothetical protein GKQ23_14290 [Erwinia sp. E602]|uniref:hypothetical protein n=1 Tax=Erwinia sp. E602 TaxID=2675378 RepID=UPI001BA64298|nr:hypothetical protein [Erwinia sp. E602]QUG76097.1 hypothetical protein GKQ23_14290 [Erwinia sp. E602]
MKLLLKNVMILFIYLISSCSSGQVIFTPQEEKLPDAKVGSFYVYYIGLASKDSGESFYLSEDNIRLSISPENSGITIKPAFEHCSFEYEKRKCSGFNKFIVKGNPLLHGVVRIDIIGRTYGSMVDKGYIFKKKYFIKIN